MTCTLLCSSARDAASQLELYEKTVAMLGYDDFFSTLDKVMVRTDASGKYAALTMEEYSKAKYAGRLSPGDSARPGFRSSSPLI